MLKSLSQMGSLFSDVLSPTSTTHIEKLNNLTEHRHLHFLRQQLIILYWRRILHHYLVTFAKKLE